MKLKRVESQLSRRGIVIVPLLDVVLNLLVIFIYVMLSMQVYQGVPVQLPWAHGEKPQRSQDLMLQLNRSGEVYWNGERVPPDQLPQKLKTVAHSQKMHCSLANHDPRKFDAGFNDFGFVASAGVCRCGWFEFSQSPVAISIWKISGE
jgi:biopolymer transport protein ExbD